MHLKHILFGILLCTICVNSHPLGDDTFMDKDFVNNVIEYWKKTRPVDHSGAGSVKHVEVVAALECDLEQDLLDEIHSYQDMVNTIIELFLTGVFRGKTFQLLANLTDDFGNRMTGSQTLEDTIDFIVDRATAEGFNVSTENVTAPYWVRNSESLFMISPRFAELNILGLGGSIGTPAEGITAPVLVVSSFDELTANAEEAAGKIVVYDVPFTTYTDTVPYRIQGAVEAARVGAVASLVRSVTDFSIVTPHTGVQFYDEDIEMIPTAAITIEDATMLHRFQDRGIEVILNLTMGAEILESTVSRNTIIEIPGKEIPEEVVVVSGHLDSWDVGVGAMDDGGGVTISYMATRALKELDLTPRRTFRTVMFTAEEQGVFGGEQYFIAHAEEVPNFQLMMESDFGTFYPRGIDFTGTNESRCIMTEILALTKLLGTKLMGEALDIPDIEPFRVAGVPAGTLNSDSANYFWFHHSNGDRLDIDSPEVMDRVAALWTSVSYVAADISVRLPHDIPLKDLHNEM